MSYYDDEPTPQHGTRLQIGAELLTDIQAVAGSFKKPRKSKPAVNMGKHISFFPDSRKYGVQFNRKGVDQSMHHFDSLKAAESYREERLQSL